MKLKLQVLQFASHALKVLTAHQKALVLLLENVMLAIIALRVNQLLSQMPINVQQASIVQ